MRVYNGKPKKKLDDLGASSSWETPISQCFPETNLNRFTPKMNMCLMFFFTRDSRTTEKMFIFKSKKTVK